MRRSPVPWQVALAQVALAVLTVLCTEARPEAAFGADAEAAVIRSLQQEFDSVSLASSSSTARTCDWLAVSCDRQGRVVSIVLDDALTGNSPKATVAGSPAHASVRLPPLLAKLPYLRRLHIELQHHRLVGGVPAGWGAAGAFPTVATLRLWAYHTEWQGGTPSLPDILPGALPQLRTLTLRLGPVPVLLPPSWGSSPDVLPRLEEFFLAPAAAPLPAVWAHGFRQLRSLYLTCEAPEHRPALPGGTCSWKAPGNGSSGGLPSGWAAGFPVLETLVLSCLPLSGSLPREWQDGGFPALNGLTLKLPGLTGTLPPQLLQRHPLLTRVTIEEGQLTGTLPEEWAQSALRQLFLFGNSLSGAAFPPAWLEAGAMVSLQWLRLAGNSNLSGTLPANLPWPMLDTLGLSGTSVTLQGSVPATWCDDQRLETLGIDWVPTDRSGLPWKLPPCVKSNQLATWLPQSVMDDLAMTVGHASDRQHGIPAFGEWQIGALMLAALVAAGAAGRVMLRRRLLLRSASYSHCHASDSSLRHDCESVAAGGAEEGAVPATAPPVGGLGSLRARKHTVRLSALLSAELDRHGGLHLAPLALAHSFEEAERSQTDVAYTSGSWGSWRSSRPAAEGLPLLQQRASASAADAAQHADLLRSPGGSEMQWQLPTQSIRVPPDHLVFLSDAQGPVILGHGSFGIVYLARLNKSRVVAAKVVEVHPGINSRAVWREVALWRRCRHERIMPLLGVAIKGPILVFATNVMAGGSLHAALRRPETRRALIWEAGGRQVAADVAEALAFMHTHTRILHGDVKSSNVLLSADLRASLGDLGLSVMLGSKARTAAGCSTLYAAPEQLLGRRCTLAADVYSLGLLLVELTTQNIVRTRVGWRLPNAPVDCPADVVALVQECLSTDPAARPSAAEVLGRLQAADGSDGC